MKGQVENQEIKNEESKDVKKNIGDVNGSEDKKIQGYTIKIEKINL